MKLSKLKAFKKTQKPSTTNVRKPSKRHHPKSQKFFLPKKNKISVFTEKA
jgi:hypothetical protein